jgi:hypothetical protein
MKAFIVQHRRGAGRSTGVPIAKGVGLKAPTGKPVAPVDIPSARRIAGRDERLLAELLRIVESAPASGRGRRRRTRS